MISYKFKLKPSQSVVSSLLFTLETCRKTYNQALAERIFSWKTFKVGLTYQHQSQLLTKFKTNDQKLVYSKIIQNVLKRLDISYKNFFRNGGFPRFQGKEHFNSFKLDQSGFKIQDNYLTISKIGTIKFVKHREIIGDIKEIQIVRRNSLWYLIITTDYVRQIQSENVQDIGVDVGLSSFLSLSNGISYTKRNNLLIKNLFHNTGKRLKKIQELQKKLSTKKLHSRKFKEIKSKIGKIHEKIVNQRLDVSNKISLELASTYKDIYIEDLNIKDLVSKNNNQIKNMTKQSITSMRRNMLLSGFGQFVQLLSFKAESAGNKLVKVDPRYSSQICPECNSHKKKTLKERIHSCECGCVLDRDHASAICILDWGLVGVPEIVLSLRDKFDSRSIAL